jgi:oligopeptide transport system substrate-binding protein
MEIKRGASRAGSLAARACCYKRRVRSKVVALLVLAACSRRPSGEYYGTTERHGKPASTFYVNNYSEPEYLDPGLATDTASGAILLDLFEGLVTAHPEDLRPTCGVAVRWDKSDDNRVYRFYLRPDARWSDGQRVVTADFVYAWSRVLDARTRARQATMFFPIKNGRLYHEGKVKVLARDETLRSAAGASGGAPLAKGTAVTVVEEQDGWAKIERFDALPTFRPKGTSTAEAPADRTPAPETPAPRAAGFVPSESLALEAGVLGVRAVGDDVLEVELEQPTPYFLELLTQYSFVPVRRDVVERFTERGEPERWYRPGNIVTNGPYVLESWRLRYEITAVRNPYHHAQDRLGIHRIVWLMIADYQTTVNLYQAGEIDYTGANISLPLAMLPLLRQYRDYSMAPYVSTYWYEVNVSKPPVDDVRVRHALNLAIDKAELVDKIVRQGQPPATHYVPDITGGGYAEVARADREAGRDPFLAPELAFDPERGRALLREAGYAVDRTGDGWQARGFPPLELLYNTAEGHQKIAVAIQDMWKRHLGVSVALRNEEWKVYLKNLRDGHFQIGRFGWTADYNHPHTFLDLFLSYSANNWTRWKSQELDALVERAARTADRHEGIHLYREAERLALSAMPRIPIYFYTKAQLVKPYVRGFWPNARNEHPIRWMWIDPAWRTAAQNRAVYAPEELPPPGRIEP